MCGCGQSDITFGGNATHSQVEPCAQITSDTLTIYLNLVQCVIDKQAYAKAGTNEKECLAAGNILTAWQTTLADGGDGCAYADKLPILQELAKRIILSGSC